jgi:hypothetical protein
MISIAAETRLFIEAALEGDSSLGSLVIAGSDDTNLSAEIAPGRKPPHSLPMGSMMRMVPSPPFTREVMVELVLRMQRRRWQRWDDFVLGLSPPDENEWQSVHAQLGVVPSIGPGWYDLVLAAAGWITELGGEIRTSDIKEKHGGLRWSYYGDVGDVGEQIIEAAEHVSDYICDVCGAPGQNTGRGWIYTRCAEHDHA